MLAILLLLVADETMLRTLSAEGALPAGRVLVTPAGKDVTQAIARSEKPNATLKLAGAGPWDVYYQSSEGMAVRVFAGLNADKTVRLEEILGVVSVRGDDRPRAKRLILTATDDPGPDEKGHVAVQWTSDYRNEMVVPEGTYTLWLVPENGARPQKLADRLRVLAGKTHVAE